MTSLRGQLPNTRPCVELTSVQAETIRGRLSTSAEAAALAKPEQIVGYEPNSTAPTASAVHACHIYLFYINAFVPVTVCNEAGNAGVINLRLGTAAIVTYHTFFNREQEGELSTYVTIRPDSHWAIRLCTPQHTSLGASTDH